MDKLKKILSKAELFQLDTKDFSFTINGKIRKIKSKYIQAGAIAGLMGILIIPSAASRLGGDNAYYAMHVNGAYVGTIADRNEAEELYMEARTQLVRDTDGLVLMDVEYELVKEDKLFVRATEQDALIENVYQVLDANTIEKTKGYTIKINEFTVTLESKNDVLTLLNAAKEKYDENGQFDVVLTADSENVLSTLTTDIIYADTSANEPAAVTTTGEEQEEEVLIELASVSETGPDGIKNISFGDTVEIVESYVDDQSITDVDEAIELVTKEQEKEEIYEVIEGDSLSVVAEKNNTSVSDIMAMNEGMDEESLIHIGDEIVVTVPQPELSVVVEEQVTYEEEYQEETQYIDNDSWYTTQEVTRQEGTVGYREVVAIVKLVNGQEEEREIVAQTVMEESLPTIIERGTQTPPTYIKPISGGTFTSGFKWRWGRQHKGVDWACPVGTAVKASSGGTVVSAGWSSGYGYCVTISHPDGKQTRYAHLSKILVSSGQSVSQGDKIALSGNTGRSTGPHVHFEIIVGGSQVDPLQYLN